MSIFEQEATPTTEKTSEGQGSFLETLVAQKGDRFRDPEELAKSKLHADTYIEELKQKVEMLSKYEALVEGLKTDPEAGLREIIKPEEKKTRTIEEPAVTPEVPLDIESQLESLLTKRDQEKRRKENLNKVEELLEESYGEKAGEFIKGKAEELGLSLTELSETAAKSPVAFARLVGLGQSEGRTSIFVQTQTNSETKPSNTQGVDYLMKQMEKNPSLYRDPDFTEKLYRAFEKRK